MTEELHETGDALERLAVLMDTGNIDLRTTEGQRLHDEIVNSRRDFCRLMGVSEEAIEHISARQALPSPMRVAGAVAILGSHGIEPADIFDKYDRALTFSTEKIRSTLDYLAANNVDVVAAVQKHPRLLGYSIESIERNVRTLEQRGLPKEFIFNNHFILGKPRTVIGTLDVLESAGMPAAELLQSEPALMKRAPSRIREVITLIRQHTSEPERILSQRPLVMTVAPEKLREKIAILSSVYPAAGRHDLCSQIPDLLLHSEHTLREGVAILSQYGVMEDTKRIRQALRTGLKNIIEKQASARATGKQLGWEELLEA